LKILGIIAFLYYNKTEGLKEVQKRFVDGIQHKAPQAPEKPLVKSVTPQVIPQPIQHPTTKNKQPSYRWLWFLGVFLIVIIVFIVLFWQALLSPKPSLIKLFLGLNGRYLILFQNNTELRPSGGFIGSFA